MNRLLLTFIFAASSLSQAAEPVVTLQSTVTGNREQPRVMYILPWQPSPAADNPGIPVHMQPGDVFAPLDRSEFRRELRMRVAADEQEAPAAREQEH